MSPTTIINRPRKISGAEIHYYQFQCPFCGRKSTKYASLQAANGFARYHQDKGACSREGL